jgi:hypothetical protein
MCLLEPVLLIGCLPVDFIQLFLFVLMERVHSVLPLNVHKRASVPVLQMLIASRLEDLETLQMGAEGLLAYHAVCLAAPIVLFSLEVVAIALVWHVLL